MIASLVCTCWPPCKTLLCISRAVASLSSSGARICSSMPLSHVPTVAGAWKDGGRSSGLYLLAKLWPEGRDFAPFVSLLPNDLPQELICNVIVHVNLAWRCSDSCSVLALSLVAKLPCPVQSNAGGPPLCVAVEQGNVPLVRSVS